MILKPYYPISGLLRVARDEDGLQLDFMSAIDGVSSFEGLQRRAQRITLGGSNLYVAALADIIKSKKAAGRPRDLAVLDALEKSLAEETARHSKSETRSSQKRK